MIRRSKYIFTLIAVPLVFVLTSPVLAQGFSISPAEVKIDNLAPGQECELDLTVYNKDDTKQAFIFSIYRPEEAQRRQGMAEFPNDSWISFPQRVEVKANFSVPVKIKLNIPSDARWAGKDWEIWLGITPESGDFLSVKLYVRLLVSTAAGTFYSYHMGRAVCGIGFALVLSVFGIYYLRHRKRYR